MDMYIQQFSAFSFIDEQSAKFDKFGFSRFKYGSLKWTKILSRQLFSRYVQSAYFETLCNIMRAGVSVHVYPPPYINVPTAGFFLAKHFTDLLNEHLYSVGLQPVFTGKIYRKKSYSTDYGILEINEREAIFEDEIFYIDSHILNNGFSIFLDDIRITGSHEKRILKMITEFAPHSINDCQFLYFASLDNQDCHPSIENQLNLWGIKEYKDIENIIRNDGIYWNTRVVKFLLELPKCQFNHFLDKLRKNDAEALYYCSINNGYCCLDTFIDNFTTLKSIINYNTQSEIQIKYYNQTIS